MLLDKVNAGLIIANELIIEKITGAFAFLLM